MPYQLTGFKRSGFKEEVDVVYKEAVLHRGPMTHLSGWNISKTAERLADALNKVFVVGQIDACVNPDLSPEKLQANGPYTASGSKILYKEEPMLPVLADADKEVELLNRAWQEGHLHLQILHKVDVETSREPLKTVEVDI